MQTFAQSERQANGFVGGGDLHDYRRNQPSAEDFRLPLSLQTEPQGWSVFGIAKLTIFGSSEVSFFRCICFRSFFSFSILCFSSAVKISRLLSRISGREIALRRRVSKLAAIFKIVLAWNNSVL